MHAEVLRNTLYTAFRMFSLYGTSIIDRLIIYSTHNGHESLQSRPAAKEDKVVPLRDLFRVVNHGTGESIPIYHLAIKQRILSRD